MTNDLRAALLADADGLAIRHPRLARPDWTARMATLVVITGAIALLAAAVVALDVDWSRLWFGLGDLGKIVTLMVPPSYGTEARLVLWLSALAETLAIAFLGTLLAAVLAFPFAFLAAKNVMPAWVFRFSVRRGFDTIRGVDTLIWALIWINVVGLGPFAGVLAIMTSDFGALGKLFSEAIENADRKPAEGIESTGGSRTHGVRFGILPEVLPVMLSQVLYYFESNTRSATIIGIVGAGGIGLHLAEQIRTLEWPHVSTIVLLILLTVAVIDGLSGRLRFALIAAGDRAAKP